MVILLDLVIIAMAYPSRMLKSVHLKYFSHKEQQRYNEGVVDPNKYDLNFSEKILISFVVLVLNLCKHCIALIMPQHRKPIQQAMREINGVVIDKKCFWSIYQVEKKDGEQNEKSKNAAKEFLMSGSMVSTPKNLALNLNSSPNFFPAQQGPYSSRDKTQYIKSFGELCRVRNDGFKPLKKISVKYNVSTSELEVLDIESTKFETYILEQVAQRPQNILQFIAKSANHKESQAIYIKFKTLREMQTFIRGIEDGEKRIQQLK